jgi:hypothetical protein
MFPAWRCPACSSAPPSVCHTETRAEMRAEVWTGTASEEDNSTVTLTAGIGYGALRMLHVSSSEPEKPRANRPESRAPPPDPRLGAAEDVSATSVERLPALR